MNGSENQTKPDAPVVSIVVPIAKMNEPPYAALDSVLEQDWPQLELVAVLGNCADDIQVRLRHRYGSGIVIVALHTADDASLRNEGFQASSGDFLMTMDVEERLTPHSVRSRASLLQTRNDVEVVYGRRSELSDGIDLRTHSFDREVFAERWPDGDIIAAYIRQPFFLHTDLLIRRSTLPSMGTIYESTHGIFAEFLMVIRLLCAARFCPAFAMTSVTRMGVEKHDRPITTTQQLAHANSAVSYLMSDPAIARKLGRLTNEAISAIHQRVADFAWTAKDYRVFRKQIAIARSQSPWIGANFREQVRWLLSFFLGLGQ